MRQIELETFWLGVGWWGFDWAFSVTRLIPVICSALLEFYPLGYIHIGIIKSDWVYVFTVKN